MVPNKINCLVVDDEPPAQDVLKNYISQVSSLELTGTCNNAVEALRLLQQKTIDLLFLDIQMPQILGTDFVRTLKKPPKLIFTTAFRKFAIEGFELDAVDYLLKPISFERFLKAVNKVMDIQLAFPVPNPISMNDKQTYGAANSIYFRSDRKMIKVELEDIMYVESVKDYIKVVTRDKTIITKHSISSLEENLPKSGFIRIHRSYIVAIGKIESYTTELIGICKQELPISRMYRHEVEKVLLGKNNLL